MAKGNLNNLSRAKSMANETFFRVPAEHLINGVRHEMEIQIYHKVFISKRSNLNLDPILLEFPYYLKRELMRIPFCNQLLMQKILKKILLT